MTFLDCFSFGCLGPGAYELRKTQSAHTAPTEIVKVTFSLIEFECC